MSNRIDAILNDLRRLKRRARGLKDGGAMLADLEDLEAQVVFFLVDDVGASLRRAKRLAKQYQRIDFEVPTPEEFEEIERVLKTPLDFPVLKPKPGKID